MKILAALGVAAFIFPTAAIAGTCLYMLPNVWLGRQHTMGAIDLLAIVGIWAAAVYFCYFVYRRAVRNFERKLKLQVD